MLTLIRLIFLIYKVLAQVGASVTVSAHELVYWWPKPNHQIYTAWVLRFKNEVHTITTLNAFLHYMVYVATVSTVLWVANAILSLRTKHFVQTKTILHFLSIPDFFCNIIEQFTLLSFNLGKTVSLNYSVMLGSFRAFKVTEDDEEN